MRETRCTAPRVPDVDYRRSLRPNGPKRESHALARNAGSDGLEGDEQEEDLPVELVYSVDLTMSGSVTLVGKPV